MNAEQRLQTKAPGSRVKGPEGDSPSSLTSQVSTQRPREGKVLVHLHGAGDAPVSLEALVLCPTGRGVSQAGFLLQAWGRPGPVTLSSDAASSFAAADRSAQPFGRKGAGERLGNGLLQSHLPPAGTGPSCCVALLVAS